MAFEWTNKQNDVDDILAEDVNLLASGILENQANLKNKIDAEDGKGLSANDYTSEEKLKLASIADGAEVNVQPDWEETDAASDSYIKNKPLLSSVATSGSYTDLTDTPELSAVAESGDYADLSGTPDIDGKINEVKNELNPALITSVPTTLEVNKEYSFGEVTELALVFPTIAEDGDVIYLTFKSGETPTTLTIDTTNTTDIEVIPEANCYYDIFAKFNGSVWLVNYSEYLVSEV